MNKKEGTWKNFDIIKSTRLPLTGCLMLSLVVAVAALATQNYKGLLLLLIFILCLNTESLRSCFFSSKITVITILTFLISLCIAVTGILYNPLILILVLLTVFPWAMFVEFKRGNRQT